MARWEHSEDEWWHLDVAHAHGHRAQGGNRVIPPPLVTDVGAYLDNAGITPEALRYAATHESLSRAWVCDLLGGLADTIDAQPDTVTPSEVGAS